MAHSKPISSILSDTTTQLTLVELLHLTGKYPSISPDAQLATEAVILSVEKLKHFLNVKAIKSVMHQLTEKCKDTKDIYQFGLAHSKKSSQQFVLTAIYAASVLHAQIKSAADMSKWVADKSQDPSHLLPNHVKINQHVLGILRCALVVAGSVFNEQGKAWIREVFAGADWEYTEDFQMFDFEGVKWLYKQGYALDTLLPVKEHVQFHRKVSQGCSGIRPAIVTAILKGTFSIDVLYYLTQVNANLIPSWKDRLANWKSEHMINVVLKAVSTTALTQIQDRKIVLVMPEWMPGDHLITVTPNDKGFMLQTASAGTVASQAAATETGTVLDVGTEVADVALTTIIVAEDLGAATEALSAGDFLGAVGGIFSAFLDLL